MKSAFLMLMIVLLGCSSGWTQNEDDYFTQLEQPEKFEEQVHVRDQVNQFTGDLNITIPLFEILGRNGLKFPVTLQYNSDLKHLSLRDELGRSPKVESIYGMGWTLGIPYISGQLCGTGLECSFNDPENYCYDRNYDTSDEWDIETVYNSYTYSNGHGSNMLIGDNFTLKDFRPWKIEMTDTSSSYPHKNWKITDENGTIFSFNHKRYRWVENCLSTGYVECDYDCDRHAYEYQWDLTKIEDRYGNSISFVYSDTLANVESCYDESLSDTSYTLSSYIDTIRCDDTGMLAIFHYEERPRHTLDIADDCGRFYDENNTVYDCCQEIYQTKTLENIELWSNLPNEEGTELIKKIVFDYEYQGYQDRLVLTKIYEKTTLDSLPPILFTYYGYNGNDIISPGSIDSIIYSSGETKKIIYERKRSDNIHVGGRVDTVLSSNGPSYNFDYSPTNAYIRYHDVYSTPVMCYHDYAERKTLNTTAKIKTTFETADSLLGSENQVEYYDNTTLVKKVVNSWNAERKASEDIFFYHTTITKLSYAKYLESRINTLDGVSDTTFFEYNDNNFITKRSKRNTNGDMRIERMVYADSIYSGMETDHIISPIVKNVIYKNSETNTNALLCEISTWQDWDGSSNNLWSLHKKYAWKEDDSTPSLPTFNFSSWSGNTEPGSTGDAAEWLRTLKIDSLDTAGNIILKRDANDVTVSTKWGYHSSKPVAQIIGAVSRRAKLGSECGYIGFESLDETSGTLADNDYWELYSANDFSTNAYTGRYSRKILPKVGTEPRYGPTKDFQPPATSQDCTFVASCWVKTQASSGDVYLIFQDKTGTSNNSVNFYESDAATGSGDWEYLECSIDMSQTSAEKLRVYVTNYSTTDSAYVDDIRVHPVNAQMTTRAYKPGTLLIQGENDFNNMATKYIFDPFQRLTTIQNENGQIITSHQYYLSRDENQYYSWSSPNYERTINYPNPDGHNKFLTDDGWTKAGITAWGIPFDDEITLRFSNDPGQLLGEEEDGTVYKSAGEGNKISRVDFYPTANTDDDVIVNSFDGANYRFAVVYIPSLDRFKIRTIRNGTSNTNVYTFSLSAPHSQWYTIEIEKTEQGGCGAWVYYKNHGRDNGKKYYTTNFPTDWNPNVLFVNTSIYYVYLANHYVGFFSNQTVFKDGLGREIQNQIAEGSYSLANKITYNDLGKSEYQYKNQRISNNDHSFYSLSGTDYVKHTYYEDPLARPFKFYHENSTDSTSIVYSSENISFEGSSFLCRYEEKTDEEGNISKTFFDKFNNPIIKYNAENSADSTRLYQEHDLLGNIVQVNPPNYHNPPTGTSASDWIITMEFNTIGQLVEKNSPDDSTTRFIYDNKGNLVFKQNAKQYHNGYDFNCYQYDQFDRVTGVGEEKDMDWTSMSFPSIGTSYGTDADEWKIKHFYDINYVSSATNNCLGRLTKTEINKDTDAAAEHIIRYVYDREGNMIEKYIKIDNGNRITEKKFSFDYDLLGRETELSYPSGNVVTKQYDQAGRLDNIISVD